MNAREPGDLRLPPMIVAIAVLIAVRGRTSVAAIPEHVEAKLVEARLVEREEHEGRPYLAPTDEAVRRVLALRWTLAHHLYEKGRALLDGLTRGDLIVTSRFTIEIAFDALAPRSAVDPTVFRENLSRLVVGLWPGERAHRAKTPVDLTRWRELAAKARAEADERREALARARYE